MFSSVILVPMGYLWVSFSTGSRPSRIFLYTWVFLRILSRNYASNLPKISVVFTPLRAGTSWFLFEVMVKFDNKIQIIYRWISNYSNFPGNKAWMHWGTSSNFTFRENIPPYFTFDFVKNNRSSQAEQKQEGNSILNSWYDAFTNELYYL